jgi:peptide/nickel transport system permease protein
VPTYVVRRLLVAVPTVVAITLLVFLALSLMAGAPDLPVAGSASGDSAGLGLVLAYVQWLVDAIQGNFGHVAVGGFYVLAYVGRGLLASATLVATALVIAVAVGIPLGAYTAMRPFSTIDHVLTAIAVLVVSTPAFLLGLGALWLFGLKLDLFPIGGMQSPSVPFNLLDFLGHLVLPAAVLGVGYAAVLLRYTRAAMLEVRGAMHVTAAEAKGLGGNVVARRHVFRNALVPILTVFGLMVPEIVGGAVIIETVFSWPGIGLMMFEAVMRRDLPVIMGVTLIVGIVVVVSSLLTDIAVAAADPRIRY